jgi:3-deoxy-manno-octulosonate cytidylyltransferase (CMP-KDO synthetase)
MKTIGIIPCRYESSRFPGKSLALINDRPMMWHVYQRALESNVLDEVYIATDDERIVEVAKKYSLNTVMTNDKLETGTDRVAEVASRIQVLVDTHATSLACH